MSAYVNSCLESLTVRDNEDKTLQEYQFDLDKISHEISELSIKKALVQKLIKDLEDSKKAKIEALKQESENKRWICPVCKVPNFMDQDRCSNCCLPTRKESRETQVI